MAHPIDKTLLRDLYETKGYPVWRIAQVLNKGQATVLRYMEIYDIPRRPQHQWLGRKHNNETKEKISTARSGKPLTEQHKRKLAAAHLGNRYNTSGRLINGKGYIMLRMPEHPMANSGGYIGEHRFVMANTLNRTLNSDELVHHINHEKTDNHPENLQLTNRVEHMKVHRKRKESS